MVSALLWLVCMRSGMDNYEADLSSYRSVMASLMNDAVVCSGIRIWFVVFSVAEEVFRNAEYLPFRFPFPVGIGI